jgi:hypothetical protein
MNFSSLYTRLPDFGIASAVEYGNYYDSIRLRRVVHRIRKATHGSSAHIPEDFRMKLRGSGNAFKRLFNTVDEVAAQAGTLSFVPIESVVEFGPCFLPQNDAGTHFRRLANASAFTCSQGTTSSGAAAWAANRRSSSCLWAAVSSNGLGSAAMESQMASTRHSRSSTGKDAAICARVVETSIPVSQ